MQNNSKVNAQLNQENEIIEKEIQTTLYEQSFEKTGIYIETGKKLSEKILNISMKIKDRYPELYKYILEMKETFPE